jgi:hypothetical protein
LNINENEWLNKLLAKFSRLLDGALGNRKAEQDLVESGLKNKDEKINHAKPYSSKK